MTTTGARVGWVVDVQNDFMEPSGRLYVRNLFDPSDRGAVQAVPAIEATVRWMREHCDVVVFTGDWHGPDDSEIDPVAPDATRGTYPPHCMGLSIDPGERRGAAVIDSVNPGDQALVVGRDATPDDARAAARRAVQEHRPIFLQKCEFCAFGGNPATEALVDGLRAALDAEPEFIVCGVATDVCVKYAVDGLLNRGRRVRVVRDATWGLGLLGPDQTFDQWARRGASLTPVAALTPND